MANCGKSDCKQQLSEVEKTIKCAGFCNRIFHSSCAGINRNADSIINSTKNLLWFCDKCLIIHKNSSEQFSALYNEILKSRDQNKALIENLYGRLKNNITNQSVEIEKAKSEILNKNDELKFSYAEALKKNDNQISSNSNMLIKLK
jgi:hypothetical protein